MNRSTRCTRYRVASPYHNCAAIVIVLCIISFDNVVIQLGNAAEVRGTSNRRKAQKQKEAIKSLAEPRIVGGTPAAAGAYPFYVSTIQPILCGGTLVAPDVVLTAAHCGGGFLAGVNVGGLLLDGTDAVETLQVDGEFPHPDYNETTRTNDIMLVKLSTPATLSPIVTLNFDPSIPAEGDVVTVIGFGDTTDGGSPSSELLMVDVDTYSDDFCFNLYNSFIPETMICAGTAAGGRDSCQGDSGGPLLTPDNVQIGLVSNGSGCARPDIPAIYTEIAGFQTYIRDGICGKSTMSCVYSSLIATMMSSRFSFYFYL
jgi:trypsin